MSDQVARRGVLRTLFDPLIIFLVLGAGLFALTSALDRDDSVITIEAGHIDRIRAQWEAQMNRQPSDEELDNLLNEMVREEIYYREAKRMGLDAGDTIIRRRLVQKLTFVTEDVADAEEPTSAMLEEFFTDNLDRYEIPERWSFRHRYFSADRRDDAESDARAALTDPDQAGDAFMLQRSYAERSKADVANLFGRQFAQGLSELRPAGWTGPIRSAYGWHLVDVTAYREARQPELAEVRERVVADFKAERRRRANENYFDELKARYTVERES